MSVFMVVTTLFNAIKINCTLNETESALPPKRSRQQGCQQSVVL